MNHLELPQHEQRQQQHKHRHLMSTDSAYYEEALQYTEQWSAVEQQEQPWHSRDSSQSTTYSSASSPTTATFASVSTPHGTSTTSLSSIASPLPLDYQHNSPDLQSGTRTGSVHKKTRSHLPLVAEEPSERDELEGHEAGMQGPSHPLPVEDLVFADAPPPGTRFSCDYPDAGFSSKPGHSSLGGWGVVCERDFGHDSDRAGRHETKRRRSGDFALNGFASRMVQRIPSLNGREPRTLKRSSLTAYLRRQRDVLSPVFGARPASSVNPVAGEAPEATDSFEVYATEEGAYLRSRHEPVGETCYGSAPMYSPGGQDELHDEYGLRVSSHASAEEGAEDDHQSQATTPLLHPLMMDLPEQLLIQPPLHSPTIATHPSSSARASHSNTPADTPFQGSQLTPPLSSKPSTTSVNRTRNGNLVPSSEIPLLIMDDDDDYWSEILGHNNFYIHPRPYLPEVCNVAAGKQLLKDWEAARAEFTKHLARTETHFGAGSRLYRLTEEKWACIDADWRLSHEKLMLQVRQGGQTPPPDITQEPAPVPKIPVILYTGAEAKFPDPGDAGIVGPIEVARPWSEVAKPEQQQQQQQREQQPLQLQRRASKRARVRNFINSISIPGSGKYQN